MSFFAISALANTLTSIVMGFLILFANHRRRLNQTFFLAAFAVAVWSFSYFMWQIATGANEALLWIHLLMAGSIFISPTYFHFVAELTHRTKKLIWWIIFGYAQAIIFSALNWTKLFIADIVPRGSFPFWPEPGVFYHPFLLIAASYIVAATILLFLYMRTTTGQEHGRVRYIFIATLIGYIGGYTNYFLWYGVPIPPFGNISTSIYIAFVAYAILKHRLFEMKVLATELLTFSLWLFIFVRVFLAETTRDQVLNGGLLVVTIVIGTLLIRSVNKEVSQRELIEEQNRKLEKANEEKSEFMSFASHEIRNPITAIRGFASLIMDGTLGPVSKDVKDAGQKILVASGDVLNLIRQFLDKSKMELGQLEYDCAPFDITAAVRNIVSGFEPNVETKQLKLTSDIPEYTLLVNGDEGKIRAVLGNLLDNSVKYTYKGGITVAVIPKGDWVRITIADTGAGIPPETLPHLFQKFSRADAKRMNLFGTGIGLYLAKEFIVAHDGKIWAESEGAGKGSTFIIELPLQAAS